VLTCPKCKKPAPGGLRCVVGSFQGPKGLLKVPVGGYLCASCFEARGIPVEVDLIPARI
jgi:hypothetical protein